MSKLNLAEAVEPLLSNQNLIDDMVRLSREGRPAVEAIGKQVAALRPGIDDAGKQQVGRLVRDRLAALGLKPVRSARVRPGNLFSWGAVYGAARPPRPTSAPATAPLFPEKPSMDQWLATVRALIAAAPGPVTNVDEFIAERRAEAVAEARKGY